MIGMWFDIGRVWDCVCARVVCDMSDLIVLFMEHVNGDTSKCMNAKQMRKDAKFKFDVVLTSAARFGATKHEIQTCPSL